MARGCCYSVTEIAVEIPLTFLLGFAIAVAVAAKIWHGFSWSWIVGLGLIAAGTMLVISLGGTCLAIKFSFLGPDCRSGRGTVYAGIAMGALFSGTVALLVSPVIVFVRRSAKNDS